MSKEDETGEYDATMDSPAYELKAKMGELYLAGEYGLEKDPSYAGKCFVYLYAWRQCVIVVYITNKINSTVSR